MIQDNIPRADELHGFNRSLQLSFLAIILISAGLGLAILG